MKNTFILAVFALLITVSCRQIQDPDNVLGNGSKSQEITKSKVIIKPAKTVGTSIRLLTLNGWDTAEAHAMVKRLANSRNSSDTVTNVWLSKSDVDSIYTLLKKEKLRNDVDGIRIYFRKNGQNGHPVLLVSTIEGDLNPNVSSGHHHKDYFEGAVCFMKTNQ